MTIIHGSADCGEITQVNPLVRCDSSIGFWALLPKIFGQKVALFGTDNLQAVFTSSLDLVLSMKPIWARQHKHSHHI